MRLSGSKNFVCIILCLLSMLLFSSCQKSEEKQPLRILTDLFCCEKAGLLHTGDGVPELEDYLRYYGIADGNFVIEVLPANKAEREVRLAALRTEIMAGGGPDVFLIRCDVPNRIINDWNFLENEHPEESTLYREPLFPDVTAAMNNSFFLPLDKYLEKAKYFR